ncbi:MAG TPA: hypothetical protein PLE33_05820 [Candidatus Cloacimonas sp.]|nr:hypothetical protein [Candidatus Cloacimonas sp.]HPS60762.1 hypothetical protein [Candidatus Cloacimonas sp.]
MLDGLMTTSLQLEIPISSFDGLSNSVSEWQLKETLRGRIRQLSATEQYKPQGQESVVNSRIYVIGKLSDHPYIAAQNRFTVGTDHFLIKTVNQAFAGIQEHHIEVDCVKTQGQ